MAVVALMVFLSDSFPRQRLILLKGEERTYDAVNWYLCAMISLTSSHDFFSSRYNLEIVGLCLSKPLSASSAGLSAMVLVLHPAAEPQISLKMIQVVSNS